MSLCTFGPQIFWLARILLFMFLTHIDYHLPWRICWYVEGLPHSVERHVIKPKGNVNFIYVIWLLFHIGLTQKRQCFSVALTVVWGLLPESPQWWSSVWIGFVLLCTILCWVLLVRHLSVRCIVPIGDAILLFMDWRQLMKEYNDFELTQYSTCQHLRLF